VEPGERFDTVAARIAAKLESWTDEEAGGARVVRRARVRGRDFSGRRDAILPDVMIAFEPGYRTSDETAAGLSPGAAFAPNLSRVAADHVDSDAEGTDGFLFTTKPFARSDPAIEDIGASALSFFGLTDPGGRPGRDLWTP